MDHGLSPDPDEMLPAAVLFVWSANGLNAAAELHEGAVNGIVHLTRSAPPMVMQTAAKQHARVCRGCTEW
ncbi:MAG: hypothetical protein ABFD44_11870 [Anaerolineaceae bacterium]